MRIYLPATLASLETLSQDGFDAPVDAHAVTPALREWYADGDAEELEYAASDAAAAASLRRLADDPSAPRRRVVVAADVPDASVRPSGAERSAVVVQVPVTRVEVASVHVDDGEAEPDVAQAVSSLDAADAGDEEARFTVDQAAGHELLRYDVTELDDVLALGR